MSRGRRRSPALSWLAISPSRRVLVRLRFAPKGATGGGVVSNGDNGGRRHCRRLNMVYRLVACKPRSVRSSPASNWRPCGDRELPRAPVPQNGRPGSPSRSPTSGTPARRGAGCGRPRLGPLERADFPPTPRALIRTAAARWRTAWATSASKLQAPIRVCGPVCSTGLRNRALVSGAGRGRVVSGLD
jgi:hypothetical protein